MEDELKVGKVTVKFALKFILWSILFFIVISIIVAIASGGALSNLDSDFNSIDDVEDVFGAIKGFIYGLVVADLLAAIIATKLSIKGISKKNKITSENRPKLVKSFAIVLAVIAVILIIVHSVIVKTIDKLIVEDAGFDSLGELIDAAEDQSDNVGRFLGINAEDEYEEAVGLLKGLNTAGVIFSISGLAYAAMIPVSNVFLRKYEE